MCGLGLWKVYDSDTVLAFQCYLYFTLTLINDRISLSVEILGPNGNNKSETSPRGKSILK